MIDEAGSGKAEMFSGGGSGSGGFSKRVLPECVVGAGPKFGRQKRELRKIPEDDETVNEPDQSGSESTSKKQKTSGDDNEDKTSSDSKKKPKPKLSFAFEEEEDEDQ